MIWVTILGALPTLSLSLPTSPFPPAHCQARSAAKKPFSNLLAALHPLTCLPPLVRKSNFFPPLFFSAFSHPLPGSQEAELNYSKIIWGNTERVMVVSTWKAIQFFNIPEKGSKCALWYSRRKNREPQIKNQRMWLQVKLRTDIPPWANHQSGLMPR